MHILFLYNFILNCLRIEVWRVAGYPKMVALFQNNLSSEGWFGSYPRSCFLCHTSLQLLLITQQNNYYSQLWLLSLNVINSFRKLFLCLWLRKLLFWSTRTMLLWKQSREYHEGDRDKWTGSQAFDKCSVDPAFTNSTQLFFFPPCTDWHDWAWTTCVKRIKEE